MESVWKDIEVIAVDVSMFFLGDPPHDEHVGRGNPNRSGTARLSACTYPDTPGACGGSVLPVKGPPCPSNQTNNALTISGPK